MATIIYTQLRAVDVGYCSVAQFKGTIMITKKEQPGHLWAERQTIEDSTTYELTHKLRLYVNDCYQHARSKERPFNLALRFDFERQGTHDDVKQIREFAHRIRMYYRLQDIELLLIWSRNSRWKSNKEEDILLVHIPEKNMEHFIKTAKGWRSDLEIFNVGYGADFEALGTKCNIIDYMTRALSTETKIKDLAAIREDSDYICGYRMFCSWSLRPVNRYKITNAKP